jgi:hypothetical protein
VRVIKIEYHEDHKDYRDHVHVTYDPGKITPKQMIDRIGEAGMPATVVRDRALEGGG